ncbi:hypothetical protein PanWU01x14_342640, partial [Parasponia andersonii]
MNPGAVYTKEKKQMTVLMKEPGRTKSGTTTPSTRSWRQSMALQYHTQDAMALRRHDSGTIVPPSSR